MSPSRRTKGHLAASAPVALLQVTFDRRISAVMDMVAIMDAETVLSSSSPDAEQPQPDADGILSDAGVQVSDSDHDGDLNAQIAHSVRRAALALHAGTDGDGAVAVTVAFGLLNVLPHFGPDLQVDVAECDALTPVLAAVARGGAHVDLLALLFAYCAVRPALATLADAFVAAVDADVQLTRMLRDVCVDAGNGSQAGSKAGFYTAIARLEQFGAVDAAVLAFLDLDLGPTLLHVWIPAWMHARNSALACTPSEALLDALIARRSGDLGEWRELAKSTAAPAQFFMYKASQRALQHSHQMPIAFYELATTFITSYVGHDSVRTGHDRLAFNLTVLMELLDHRDLNLLCEPHLVLLLHVSLQNIVRCCLEGHARTLHTKLRTLGSILSLPALLNMLQYLICKFILSVGNTTLCARRKAAIRTATRADNCDDVAGDSDNWFKLRTKYELPACFDEILPSNAPVPRSLFGYAESSVESEPQANNATAILQLLLESLGMLLRINRATLDLYKENKVGALDIQGLQSDLRVGIHQRAVRAHLDLYYISNFAVLVLSEQLRDPNGLSLLLGHSAAALQSRLMLRNALKCFESLMCTHCDIALYNLVRFATEVSVLDLLLQRQCITVFVHLFFHARTSQIRDLCMANELTYRALRDYVEIWNDGGAHYTGFFEQLFGTSQPAVTTRRMALRDLLPDDLLHNTKMLTAAAPVAPRDPTPTRAAVVAKGSKSRYNAHATSFVPASKAFSRNFLDQGTSFTQLRPTATAQHDLLVPHTSLSSSTWDSSCFSDSSVPTTSSAGVVSTGKNYILGGHNRATNNSRAQSVHVDVFENR
ncbi:LAFE_0H12552g1_1 [Lachancea fermentati]|uniref:LAFE_0H12552g1_1 n=1 Tax=Lachancea fermentati TaxID=4955 RepID=A0A1G4MKJ6_LACFM|nr:LAFE_0H12552g1_1 [Lachancea fermentati]